MSNSSKCANLNNRGRWCGTPAQPGTNACRHHQHGPVRDFTPDDYKVADAVEAGQQRAV